MENLDPASPPNQGWEKWRVVALRAASSLIWGDGGLLFHFILSKIVALTSRWFCTDKTDETVFHFFVFRMFDREVLLLAAFGRFSTRNENQHLQPRTKPVETNRENAYFFLSSRQKLKPPPNECPISPLPLSKVVQDSMAIIHVGFQTKATLNRGWGGGLLFVFRGDGSRAQKLENRWNCLNSSVRGCSSTRHVFFTFIHLLNKLYSEEAIYIMNMPIILALYSVLRVHIMT